MLDISGSVSIGDSFESTHTYHTDLGLLCFFFFYISIDACKNDAEVALGVKRERLSLILMGQG